MDENETYKAGLAVRRKVLGEQYVNDSLAKADEFTAPLQQFLTEHAWGAVWTREGLTHRTRSMLNLAILTATNEGDPPGGQACGAAVDALVAWWGAGR